MPSYSEQHLSEAKRIIELIDSDKIEKMVELLADLRRREGRLFFLGSGGGGRTCFPCSE